MFEGNIEPIRESLRLWLNEDIGTGDLTTLSTIPLEHRSKGIVHVKESGIICGLPIAEMVFEVMDKGIKFTAKVEEGSQVSKGTIIAEVEGSTRSILMAERVALNLMQRMSGIATQTKVYVDALNGFPVRLIDTRKTTPGHRLLEKYAIRMGGGYNHRFGLYDAVIIKDNHIKAAGSISKAIEMARNSISHMLKIEVEVETLEQVEEALSAKPDIIMLDNMKSSEMKEAVERIHSKAPHIVIEASGGVTLESIKEIALTGVNVISVGKLTSSTKTLDISLDLNDKKE